MKKILLKIAVVISFCISLNGLQAQSQETHITCGTDEVIARAMKANPNLVLQMQERERQIMESSAHKTSTETSQAIFNVPVVVHVVWNTSSQNIPDTSVQTIIDALNRDFRKQNSDWTLTPTVWQGIVADMEVQFCLASKDPSGNATTGITHTQSSVTSWATDDKVKYTSNGGADAWNRDNYMNIWICLLSGNVGGYAYIAGTAPQAAVDGVVISSIVAAQGSGSISGYQKARVAVHEVGHWLGLYHNFQSGCSGCDVGNCTSGGDRVCDTPCTTSATYGCPGNVNTCTDTPTDFNDMTMNYMDYTYDQCKYMFTSGQKVRMASFLAKAPRLSLQSSSTSNCSKITTSVHAIENEKTISVFPNPSEGKFIVKINVANLGSMEIKILNALGEEVLVLSENSINPKEINVDLSSQPNGVYFLNLKTEKKFISEKISVIR